MWLGRGPSHFPGTASISESKREDQGTGGGWDQEALSHLTA